METNVIYNEDCIGPNGMCRLPDNSMDLIVIDPPYNIGKAEWDKIDNYIEWMGEVFTECERLLKDNGSFYFWHSEYEVIQELQGWTRKNTNFVFKQFITWFKVDPSFSNYGFAQQRLSNGTMRNYYDGFTEYCLFYTFQDETGLKKIHDSSDCFAGIKKYLRQERKKLAREKSFNLTETDSHLANLTNTATIVRHYWGDSQWELPTREMYEKMQQTGFFRREYEDLRREYEDLRYTFNVGRVKDNLYCNSNVWLHPPAERSGHITPKPVPLIENIIKHSSNEGDIVFDCFMGSGTTAIAAHNTGRKWIGFENDEEYCRKGKERIEEHTAQQRLIV